MSSEKPFWEGKTLMEIQNLDQRVKVTMENGDVFIGKLIRRSRDTDGICHLSMQLDAHRTYLHVFSAESSDTPPVIPSYVDTIELVDDPEYERIDNIEDVREGDEVFTLSGNKYKARAVYESMEVYVDGDGFSPIIQRKYFAYALRRKPKLPDHDGLWLDKNGKTWVVSDSSQTLFDPDSLEWFPSPDPAKMRISGDAFGTKSDDAIDLAPFRPAKAVEA